jgi:hypothetical protein
MPHAACHATLTQQATCRRPRARVAAPLPAVCLQRPASKRKSHRASASAPDASHPPAHPPPPPAARDASPPRQHAQRGTSPPLAPAAAAAWQSSPPKGAAQPHGDGRSTAGSEGPARGRAQRHRRRRDKRGGSGGSGSVSPVDAAGAGKQSKTGPAVATPSGSADGRGRATQPVGHPASPAPLAAPAPVHPPVDVRKVLARLAKAVRGNNIRATDAPRVRVGAQSARWRHSGLACALGERRCARVLAGFGRAAACCRGRSSWMQRRCGEPCVCGE